MCSANGAPTPGLFAQLADSAARSIALGREQTLGRFQQVQNFGAHSRSQPQGDLRSVHPHYLSVYASTADFDRLVLYGSCNTRYWARG